MIGTHSNHDPYVSMSQQKCRAMSLVLHPCLQHLEEIESVYEGLMYRLFRIDCPRPQTATMARTSLRPHNWTTFSPLHMDICW